MPGPQQIRQQLKREEKLEDIREQIANGRLVVRQMTAEERKHHPVPAQPRQRAGAKRRR